MAIFVRQTNVIWVATFAAERIVDLLEAQTPKSIGTLVSRNMHTTWMHAKVSKKCEINKGLGCSKKRSFRIFFCIR